MKNVEHLLKSISILQQRIKDREENEERFNLFDLMLKRTDEKNLHSRFLAILLDPHGCYKMKDTFLRLFISRLNLNFEYDLSSVEVIPNGRRRNEHKNIDILLIDRDLKSAVIIENKIFARDSNHEYVGQLENYYEEITQKEGIPADRTEVIYLSLDRDSPSYDSVGKSGKFPELKDKVMSIHYGFEILDWLNACIKECYSKPFLRESINQYINLITDMTNNSTSEEDIKTLLKIVGINSGNLSSAKLLADNLKHLYWWSIYEFWKLLSEKLIRRGYTIRNRIENEEIDNLVHGNRTSKKVDFNLGVSSPNGVKFIINADYNHYICMGVIKSEINKKTPKKAKAFFKEKEETLSLVNGDNWPFYCYFKFEDSDGLCLSDPRSDITFSLISSYNREKITDSIIKQTESLLKEYDLVDRRQRAGDLGQ